MTGVMRWVSPILRLLAEAEKLIDSNAEKYFATAQTQVEDVIEDIFAKQPRTLQKLSATFRRGDLIEALTGQPVRIEIWIRALSRSHIYALTQD